MQISNEKEYWCVGKTRSNKWKLKKVPYDKWEDKEEYEILEGFEGDIKDIKIEFDGVFNRNYQKSNFEFYSDNTPWLFVLMNDGRLYVKKALAEVRTAILVSSNVSCMYPCRGWKSEIYPELDFGLWVGYIKEGRPYYANYHDLGAGEFGWEMNILIDDSSDNIDIKIIRLNDYRMGIQLISPTENRIYVTERLYIGGTLSTLFFSGEFRRQNFLMLNPSRVTDPDYYNLLDPKVTLDNSSETTIVRVHCTYPFISIDKRCINFENPIVPAGSSYLAIDIDADTGDLLLTLDVKMPNIHSHVKFQSKSFNRVRFKVTDYCSPVLPVLTFETEPRKQEVKESFRGKFNSIAADIDCVRKRRLSSEVLESFMGKISSVSASTEISKKRSLQNIHEECFIGSLNSTEVQLEFEFSGQIIG